MTLGRWMVVTGVTASRHRSLRDARAEQRVNLAIGARLMHYRSDRVDWIKGTLLYEMRGHR